MNVTQPEIRASGAPGGTRTHGLLLRRQTLYPLSYGRVYRLRDAGWPLGRIAEVRLVRGEQRVEQLLGR